MNEEMSLFNQSFNPFNPRGLRSELNETLGTKVTEHRNRFVRLFYARYLELLPTTITYYNYNHDERVKVDWLKTEFMLRNGYNPVLAITKAGYLRLVGYVTSNLTSINPMDLFTITPLTKKDITFIVDERLLPDTMIELTYVTQTLGNFIVLRNKTFDFTNDMEIVWHYTQELAENVSTRYSLKIQTKATTVFRGVADNQTMNEMITRIYNGDPAVKGSKAFDPKNDIFNMDFTDYAGKTPELKRDYQNSLNELNAMLGFSTLGVDKEAGVNETESNSGKAFSTANGNVYIKSRQNSLDLLNKAHGFQIYAMFDDSAISTLMLQGWLIGEKASQPQGGVSDESDPISRGISNERTNQEEQE